MPVISVTTEIKEIGRGLMMVKERIEKRTLEYGNLSLFQAFAKDLIPVEHFPEFFREQYMAARWFQDFIWASTEVKGEKYRAFSTNHRKVDSGHHNWMKHDLREFGMDPMTTNDFFDLAFLPSRIQLARILALFHKASDDRKMLILCCLESAGTVTLGTLFEYVARHGLLDRTHYLGQKHIKIEETQVDEISEVAAAVMNSVATEDLEIVDEVFDALTTMFSEGGDRYYAEYLRGLEKLVA